MIIDCDRIWTGLVTAVYRIRRKPRVTNDPPPVTRASRTSSFRGGPCDAPGQPGISSP